MFSTAQRAGFWLMVLTAFHAQAASVTLNLSVSVAESCQVQAVSEAHLTLLCTSGFTPASPLALPELAARIPATPWQFQRATANPQGGTLNEYVAAPSAALAAEGFVFY